MAEVEGVSPKDLSSRARALAKHGIDETRLKDLQRSFKIRIRREGLAAYAEYRKA